MLAEKKPGSERSGGFGGESYQGRYIGFLSITAGTGFFFCSGEGLRRFLLPVESRSIRSFRYMRRPCVWGPTAGGECGP